MDLKEKINLVGFADHVFHRLWNETSKSLVVALFYGICSTSMNFLNKTVVTSFNFNYPFFIMTIQVAFSTLVLELLRHRHLIRLHAFSLSEGSEMASASFLFAGHATLSLFALSGMNIPMYGAIKRCTPLVNLVLSVVILKKGMPSKYLIASILVITFGCLIAGFGDLQFDQQAYLMATLSVFAQGGYLTLIEWNSSKRKSTLTMVYINGINTLPIFAILCFATGEFSKILSYQLWKESDFLVAFSVVIVWGSVLTFSQFLCASVCSALTASLVSVAKSAIQTSLGYFTFGGVIFHPLNVLGLTMNFIGGMMYTFIKLNEKKHGSHNMVVSTARSIESPSMVSLDRMDQNNVHNKNKNGKKHLKLDKLHIHKETSASTHQL